MRPQQSHITISTLVPLIFKLIPYIHSTKYLINIPHISTNNMFTMTHPNKKLFISLQRNEKEFLAKKVVAHETTATLATFF